MSDCANFFEMKKIFTFLFALVMSAGLAKTASAADVYFGSDAKSRYVIGTGSIDYGDWFTGTHAGVAFSDGTFAEIWVGIPAAGPEAGEVHELDLTVGKKFMDGKLTAKVDYYSILGPDGKVRLGDEGDIVHPSMSLAYPVGSGFSALAEVAYFFVLEQPENNGVFMNAGLGYSKNLGGVVAYGEARAGYRTYFQSEHEYARVLAGIKIPVSKSVTVLGPEYRAYFAPTHEPVYSYRIAGIGVTIPTGK
ncbi:MAG: hypothetical protein H8D63_02905 [Parcubacteria group bacterium]|nr:hypothetical protein [Parcubacteria group bacterium]